MITIMRYRLHWIPFLAMVIILASLVESFTLVSLNSPKTDLSISSTKLGASIEEEEEQEQMLPSIQPEAASQEAFPSAEFISFQLDEHKPLGCTVEETLDSLSEYVFVSKVVPGGLADKAGIQVGDVIVAVTGLFGEVTTVLDSGIEKLKGLVASVPAEDSLRICIARGTDVLEKHETALVDLCSSDGASDSEVEGCIVDFIKDGYNLDEDDDQVTDCGDEDTECLIDNMMDLWAEELPPPPPSSTADVDMSESSSKQPKPWSSRSSPSGTYVRDPVTGEMKNIDSTDWQNNK